jgi:TonB family protein
VPPPSAIAAGCCALVLCVACGHRTPEPAAAQESGQGDLSVSEPPGRALSAKRRKAALFFNDLKNRVRARWNPAVQRLGAASVPDGGARATATVLAVVLDRDGRLVRFWIQTPSGLEDIDRTALEAFQEAQPFSPPPPELVEPDGFTRFLFGFFLEPGPGRPHRFKVFRYNQPDRAFSDAGVDTAPDG